MFVDNHFIFAIRSGTYMCVCVCVCYYCCRQFLFPLWSYCIGQISILYSECHISGPKVFIIRHHFACLYCVEWRGFVVFLCVGINGTTERVFPLLWYRSFTIALLGRIDNFLLSIAFSTLQVHSRNIDCDFSACQSTLQCICWFSCHKWSMRLIQNTIDAWKRIWSYAK